MSKIEEIAREEFKRFSFDRARTSMELYGAVVAKRAVREFALVAADRCIVPVESDDRMEILLREWGIEP